MATAAIVGWVVAAILLATTAIAVALHRDAVQTALTRSVVRTNTGRRFSTIEHASSIALTVGAVAAVLVVVVAAVGARNLWRNKRTGRTSLVLAAVLALALAVGFWFALEPARADVEAAGIPGPLFWAVYVSAAIGLVSTALTFAPSVTVRLRD